MVDKGISGSLWVPKRSGYLDGQLLIAMPGMRDERFVRTVVYVCAHSEAGAIGLVLNSPVVDVGFSDLLTHLDLAAPHEQEVLSPLVRELRVCHGGPMETQRGFVLHSSDCSIENATLPIDDKISLTSTIDILKVLADGKGPEQAILALGYAGWAPGQLENEVKSNGWLHGPADLDIVFTASTDDMYDKVIRRFGIEPCMLSSETGHA